mgnify:CR=1 FL=1
MSLKASTASTAATKIGKRHSEEFRREAVRILEAGRSATQLARELGVSTWSLSQWKKRYGIGKAGTGPAGRSRTGTGAGDADAVALADELASVRAELHAVTRQREILKKALAILGQESPNVMF